LGTGENLPFAYCSRDASVHGVNLLASYCYLIQGRSRTGKTNVLKILLYAAAQNEKSQIVLIEQKSEELKNVAAQLHVRYLQDEMEIYEFFKETVPVFKERNKRKLAWQETGMEQEEIAAKMIADKPIFIFIADLVSFVKSAYSPKNGVGEIHQYLENITEKGISHGFYFIACINPEQVANIAGYQVYLNMASYKTGIHLGGNTSGQRLFQFTNIPFQEQNKSSKPGSGLVPSKEDSGVAEQMIIPLIKGGFS
jgi:S-DNA-T family DNA segregation ATPase FtsK/SpoIIIE